MFKFMNVACVSKSSFYRHARSYINPIIIKLWKEDQEQLLDSLSDTESGLVLAGDGRCDSPGYCAKFGSFTLLEQQINRVVDFQLVQVSFCFPSVIKASIHFLTHLYALQSNEVKNSAWMENEGLVRAVRVISNAGLHIAEIITDRHKQNAAWIRRNLPDTAHYYDIWHVSKGKFNSTQNKTKTIIFPVSFLYSCSRVIT